ncbi:MAG: hypothetical protein FJ265_08085 [Planctomycetes bacterium]|nr:hypothetical protein [Planctomycetota bacterium]
MTNAPVQTRAPLPRGRPRWRLLLAVGLLAILLGRGLGLTGSGEPDSGERDPAGAVPGAVPARASAAAAAAVPEPVAAPNSSESAAARPGPIEPASAAPLAEVAPAPPVAPAVDADRFGSLLALLEAHTEDRRLGRALALLRELRALPLDGAQTAALALPARTLEDALARACSDVVQMLSTGRVLEAATAVRACCTDDQGLVAAALQQSLALCGLSGDLQALPGQAGAPWPLPRPLPRQRAVRAVVDGAPLAAHVVDSRADQVTLRVLRGGVVTFPTLPVAAVEPLDASAAEAVEMAFAALHARDGRLARLWACAAALRGARTAVAERFAVLERLLAGAN